MFKDDSRTPKEIWKEFFSRVKPLPTWFRKLCETEHTMEYRGLKIPKITMRPKVIGNDFGPIFPGMRPTGRNVGIGFSVNGKDIWGWLDTAPEFWDEKLTKGRIKSGFAGKLARHMNSKYGPSFRKNPKKFLEEEFGIKIRGEISKTKHVPVKWLKIGKGKTFDDLLKGK